MADLIQSLLSFTERKYIVGPDISNVMIFIINETVYTKLKSLCDDKYAFMPCAETEDSHFLIERPRKKLENDIVICNNDKMHLIPKSEIYWELDCEHFV